MPFLGELSALLTAFCWASGSLVFAAATRRLGSYQVNITRLILASLFLLVLIALLGLDINLSSSQLVYLGISGFIGLTLGDTFLFKAFEEIGARLSMLMMSLAPTISALLAFFVLKETLSIYGIIGIAVTVSGVSIVVLERGAKSETKILPTTAGIIYALLGAIGQGVGLIFAKLAFMESEINGFVATEVRIIFSLIFLIPIAVLTNRFKNPIQIFKEDRKGTGLIALGAILGPFLGISFSLIAIAHTKIGIAATIMATVPIIMLPMVWIVYKEKLSLRAIGGAFVAVSGVAILFIR